MGLGKRLSAITKDSGGTHGHVRCEVGREVTERRNQLSGVFAFNAKYKTG